MDLGKLVLSDSDPLMTGGYDIDSPMLFDLTNCLAVPGPKHMVDNIIGDVLERLGKFKWFQARLKSCCAAWHEEKTVFQVFLWRPQLVNEIS